jgi:hypothetical protein
MYWDGLRLACKGMQLIVSQYEHNTAQHSAQMETVNPGSNI